MSRGGMFIRINLGERRLYLYQGDQLYGSYKVAIGKPSTPSPVGTWTIANKSILAGGTVYGTRWIGLSINTYGIHGNNNPRVIGQAVSLGCIRMYNQDVEAIFPLVPLGTTVEITAGGRSPVANPPGAGDLPTDKLYVVKKGDTLWSIATRFGLALDDILKLNPSLNADLIYPGDVIRLK